MERVRYVAEADITGPRLLDEGAQVACARVFRGSPGSEIYLHGSHRSWAISMGEDAIAENRVSFCLAVTGSRRLELIYQPRFLLPRCSEGAGKIPVLDLLKVDLTHRYCFVSKVGYTTPHLFANPDDDVLVPTNYG